MKAFLVLLSLELVFIHGQHDTITDSWSRKRQPDIATRGQRWNEIPGKVRPSKLWKRQHVNTRGIDSWNKQPDTPTDFQPWTEKSDNPISIRSWEGQLGITTGSGSLYDPRRPDDNICKYNIIKSFS